jgi:hypothetical protein
MSRSWKSFLLAMVAAFGLVSSASAGNITITGHDDDFHANARGLGSDASNQLKAMAIFARNGSALPVLTFDHGTELTNSLTALGIPFTNVDPNNAAAVNAIFATGPAATFSAIAVASDFRCGGCDNDDTSTANLVAHKTDIANFVNAGRGIFAMSGASNANYYNFLPNTAAPFGSPPATGYVQTADGLAAGIPAANGDPTHNFFNTALSDPAWKVFERLGDPVTGTPETLGITGATISVSGFGAVPEPGTLALATVALLGALGYRLRRRKPDAA